MVTEQPHEIWRGHWNGRNRPLADALALAAGGLQHPIFQGRLEWSDGSMESDDLDSLLARAEHRPMPEWLLLRLQDALEGPNGPLQVPSLDSPAAVTICAGPESGFRGGPGRGGPGVTIDASGTDFKATRLSFRVAQRHVEQFGTEDDRGDESPVGESNPSLSEPVAQVENRAGVAGWIERNAVVIEAVTAILAVLVAAIAILAG